MRLSWLLLVGVLACRGDAAPTASGPAASAGAPKAPPKPLQVQVVRVAAEDLAETITASGELLPNEAVVIVAELARRLAAVHVDEGSEVVAGQLLFELDKADLEARLARLQVQSRYGRAALGRRAELLAQGGVSAEEKDNARQRVDEAGAAAREVEVELGKTRIVAPFAGRIGRRDIAVGAWVGPNVPLTTLYDLSKLKVDFRIPERYANRLGKDVAKLTFSFRVEGRPEEFAGRVIAVEPRVEASTRSLVVRGVVDDPQGLVPGTFTTVSLVLSRARAIFVPAIAVMPSPTGTRLFVARDGKATEVKVEIGRREPERVEIVKGLSDGDQVIVTNLLRVKNGAPVAIIEPAGGSRVSP